MLIKQKTKQTISVSQLVSVLHIHLDQG